MPAVVMKKWAVFCNSAETRRLVATYDTQEYAEMEAACLAEEKPRAPCYRKGCGPIQYYYYEVAAVWTAKDGEV